MIRIAHVYRNMLKGGGAEPLILSIIRGVDRSRFEPYLILSERVRPEHDLSGVEVLDAYGGVAGHPWWRPSRFAVGVAREVRRRRIDIVHAHDGARGYSRLAVCLGKLSGAMVLRTAHNVLSSRKGTGVLERACVLSTDAWSVVSPDLVAAAQRVAGARMSRIWVIPNGVDLGVHMTPCADGSAVRRKLGVAEGTLLFVAVGRLARQKDYPTMIRAFALAAPRLPACLLLIAGEGDERTELATLIGALGLLGRVRLLGLRDDVPDLLAVADVFVMSSLKEGCSRAAIEAMAAGLPIVATDVPGLRHVLDYGRAGILVPSQCPESLSEAMVAVVLNPSLREELAATGRKRAMEEFSVETMVRRYEELYEALAARRGLCTPGV